MDYLTDTPYQLIDGPQELKGTLRNILDAHQTFQAARLSPRVPLLYVDLEGKDLCRNGSIALIQVHVPIVKRTFIIDALVLGAALFETSTPAAEADLSSESSTEMSPFPTLVEGDPITLKSILESSSVLKCFFDCRNDADALYNLCGVSMSGVVDIQILEIATRRGPKRFLNGLARAIKIDAQLEPEVLARWLKVKSDGKALFNPPVPSTSDPKAPTKENLLESLGDSNGAKESSTSTPAPSSPGLNQAPDFEVFNVRPLSRALLEYSINDVIHLPRLWAFYDAKLDNKWRVKTENEFKWRLQLAKQDVYYGKNGNMALSPF